MNNNTSNPLISFLSGGGEMGHLIRQKDWSKTPVGNPESWPQSLRTTISIVLNSKFPMFLFWGPELTCFYNDAFRPSLGDIGKHPFYLGSPAEEFWGEVWTEVKPMIHNILAGEEAILNEDFLLPICRNKKVEDVYWTFSNSPVRDESGKIAGVLACCVETTNKVVALKKLSESQEKLNFAINAANLGTWDFNPQTNRFIYNEQLRNWFGLGYEYEMEAPLIMNSIAESDRQKTIDSIAKAMAKGSDGNYEVQHAVVSPIDGTKRVLLAKGKVLFDEYGIAYRFCGIGQDITKDFLYRKNEEEKNLFNKLILESSPDCVKIIDPDGRISYINQNGVCVLEGDNEDEFINRKWETMWGMEEEIIIQNALKSASKGEKINFQAPSITAKGNHKWWDVIVSALPNESGVIKNLLAVSRDITGIKNAEKSLEESEEQLRFALEGGNLGYFDVYPKMGELNWSNKAKEFFGLTPEAEVNLEICKKMVHPDDYENVQNGILTALQNNKSDLYEGEFRTSHQKTKWLKVIGKIKCDENGEPVRVTGVIQNITDKKLADIKLTESEKNFRTLADQAPIWIWLTDSEVNVIYTNPALLNYLGIERFSDFAAKVWETFAHPDHLPYIYEKYKEASTQKKSVSFESLIKNVDSGNYEWVSIHVVARTEGDEFAGFIGTGFNIHQQKIQLLAIEESEEKFRTLTESLPQMIWITDEKGNVKFLSKRWQEFTNNHDTLFEKWREIVHPDDIEGVNNVWAHSLSTGNVYKYDMRLRDKNGEYVWFTVSGEPIFNTQNEIIKWIGSFTNIDTEKGFLQELEKQVNERTKELVVAKDNLILKNGELLNMNKELESFAYVSSHDLQEPLRKIQTFSSRILEKENDNLSESGKEYLKRMRVAGERMQQLIQDLLAYSRTKTSDVKYESLDLGSILVDIKEDLKEELKQKNVIIETDETCLIKANFIPFQFRQLLYNLISNSVKFSKTDGTPIIKLFCEIKVGSELSYRNLRPDVKYYHLKVADNGIGFSSSYKEKIFEIFQRLHGREEYTGTGIGLAIVKKIIENHNGCITADGELGLGATFDIYIPMNL